MASEVTDAVRDVLGGIVRDALENAGSEPQSRSGALSGVRGIAAGMGLAALAPLAFGKLRDGLPATGPGASEEDAGGSDEDDGGDEPQRDNRNTRVEGVGKGRRMPVQQAVDVAVPLETAYNQWTQFEDWPSFMHRVTRVTQEDECTVGFATKIWGKTKEFTAQIETQRPDQRIKWRVSEGITHSGVVTFHELAENLTRIELTLDVDPGSLIEKAARGMRHVKRAVRADLHRFKAFIEMQELETGAWRGVIEDGELVEPHDESYDEERDYSDVEDAYAEDSEEAKDSEDSEEDDQKEERRQESQRERAGRFKRQAESAGRGGGERSRSTASSSSSSRPRSSNGGSASESGSSSGSRSSGRPRNGNGGSGQSRSRGGGSSSSSPRRRSSSRS